MWRALAATVLFLTAAAADAHAVERIAYGATGDIYVIGSDGTSGDNLTDTVAGSVHHPEWSPDGKRILFIKDFDVWVVDADGTDATAVIPTTHPEAILGAVWSPDSSRIAYTRYDLETNTGSIETADAEGTDVRPVTSELPHEGRLSWSPGGQLLYTHEFGAVPGVRTVAATGGTPTTVVPAATIRAYHPRWSPNGNRIVFLGCEPDPNCNSDIWVMDADGGNRSRLTDFPGGDVYPAWSADGATISWARFVSPTAGWRLHTMDADGDNEVAVPNGASGAQVSTWEPLPDSDGDALLDTWETSGVDVDGDAIVDLNLPAMGADPDHKDIFVELDQMTGHSPPSVTSFDSVKKAFADAPVDNPDGVDGIDLHIDFAGNAEMDPDTGATWGSLTRANAIPHTDTTGSFVNGTYGWAPFETIKQANFDAARADVFHYAISLHGVGGFDVGGLSRNSATGPWNASDFFIAVHESWFALNTEHAQRVIAGIFMHELGHNLGLRHGGFEDTNYKPPYLSIMNYSFVEGLMREDGSRFLDFSRFDFPLDEATLDEATGIGASGAAATLRTLAFCPDGTTSPVSLRADPADWDCDGVLHPGTLALDVNDDNQTSVLSGHLDWENLVFAGGSIGAGAPTLPNTTPVVEPTFEEGRRLSESLEGPLRSPPVSPSPGAGNPGSNPAPPSPTAPAPRSAPPPVLAPALGGLRVGPSRFRAARDGGAIVKRGGARVTFTLSAAARVVFSVRHRSGTRVKGSFRHAGAAGANTLRFSGRLGGRRLRPGRYRLVATPAGGKPVTAVFTIRR